MIHFGNFLTGIISYVIRSMLANAYINSKRTTDKWHLAAAHQIVILYSSVLFFFKWVREFSAQEITKVCDGEEKKESGVQDEYNAFIHPHPSVSELLFPKEHESIWKCL